MSKSRRIEAKNYSQHSTIIDCERDVIDSGGHITKLEHIKDSIFITCDDLDMDKFKKTFTYKLTI